MVSSGAVVNGKTCRQCGGQSQTDQPIGWYSLSVGVPPEAHPNGYKWVGIVCLADCLADYMPEIQRMADLADLVFTREKPLRRLMAVILTATAHRGNQPMPETSP